MIRRIRPLTLRAFFAACAIAAGAVAWRSGGGAEGAGRPSAKKPAKTPAESARKEAAGGDTYEVAIRLIELARDARFEMKKDPASSRVIGAHWRKLTPPFASLSGVASRWVASVGLRTSGDENQFSAPLASARVTGGPAGAAAAAGKAWTPDARIWNMNEGTFDHRESILSPPGSTVTFKTTIPRGARLTFAEGTLNATNDETVFAIALVDERGATHEVHRHVLPPESARRWTRQSVDLSTFAGQSVELRLSTGALPAPAPSPAPPDDPKKKPRAGAHGRGRRHAPPRAKPRVAGAKEVKEDALAIAGTPVGVWGNPTILAKKTPRVPYNVLWVVVEALRPDVIASFHDEAEDAERRAAKHPPLEALLPKVPGLTPSIDELASRGVRFTHAYSAASWTRPGTLAMLCGARSSELGIETTGWLVGRRELARFYASDPPLVSLLLRRHGVATRAFVNNYFMVGYAPVGLDMGFERVADERWRTRDTAEITRDATTFLDDNKDTRFFLFVNYNSPHEPYEPPKKVLERVPPPPVGPKDPGVRSYMAEAAKDDEAIGVLLRKLDETGLRDRTIIVVTADHGETISSAHRGTSALDTMPIRYHHSVGNFEETTRVPIVLVAPGVLPAGREVKARTRTVDIAPTLAELLDLEAPARMSGRSLVALARGETEPDERVVVTEGRLSRAIMSGRHRLIVSEGAARTTTIGERTITASELLYDLVDDPGERHDLAPSQPHLVAEMKARLSAALENVPVAGSAAAIAPPLASPGGDPSKQPILHLRFVGRGRASRVSGALTIGDDKTAAKSFEVRPIEIDAEAIKVSGSRVELALTTAPDAAVGVDVVVDPPAAPVRWELYADDAPWPAESVFGGAFGLAVPALRDGIAGDEARAAAAAPRLPPIDPRRDSGLFVVRERRGEVEAPRGLTEEGAEEMTRLLEEWGYAHASGAPKRE